MICASTKHTPGPWGRTGLVIEVRHRGIIASCPTPQTHGVFECVANARLIAAAPDLLEACENLVGVFDSRARDETELLVIERAVQAIAKAKGEK